MDPPRVASLDTLKKGEDISYFPPSLSTVEDLYQTCSVDAANIHIRDDEGNTPMPPATPDINRMRAAVFPQYSASPPTWFLPTFPKAVSIHPELIDYPSSPSIEGLCTPKGVVFDPFAPAPDMFLLAPHSRKHTPESPDNVVLRQLTFDSCPCFLENTTACDTEIAISEEEMVFQTVHGILLEAILSTQTKGIPSSEKYPSQVSVVNGFETPNSATRLSGVAKTCPHAPVKPSMKSRRIQAGLCRKLEF